MHVHTCKHASVCAPTASGSLGRPRVSSSAVRSGAPVLSASSALCRVS